MKESNLHSKMHLCNCIFCTHACIYIYIVNVSIRECEVHLKRDCMRLHIPTCHCSLILLIFSVSTAAWYHGAQSEPVVSGEEDILSFKCSTGSSASSIHLLHSTSLPFPTLPSPSPPPTLSSHSLLPLSPPTLPSHSPLPLSPPTLPFPSPLPLSPPTAPPSLSSPSLLPLSPPQLLSLLSCPPSLLPLFSLDHSGANN